MVLVESRVLGSNHGVLEIRRDFVERNECVAFVIRPVVNPSLQTALDVQRSRGRVDPPGGDKGQSGKQPKKRHTDDQPSNKYPQRGQETLPTRDTGAYS